jgi:hypothetical protein
MRVALTGGAYQARSVIASAQRAVNLIAEPLPGAQGEPAQMAHFPTPGLVLHGTVGNGPIRGIRQCTTGAVYCVSGPGVYRVAADGSGTSLGTITAGLRTPVSMVDNGLDLVIVDGTARGWSVNLAANTMSEIIDPGGMFAGATSVDYLDTYLLFNKPGTPQFYWTGSLALTFDALDFANKESFSDLLVALRVAKREIWLLGQRTSEIYVNTGQAAGIADSTFTSMQGVFIDNGCIARYSPAEYDNAVYWLGSNRSGERIVLSGAGYQTKRISTYAIEAALAGYDKVDDAVGWTYSLGGHAFYVLCFPHVDTTWVHDITTGLWHEWLWIDSNGTEHRHRGMCAYDCNGQVLVGDWQSGNIYILDQNVGTDCGQPIKRVRSFPHVLNDGKRVFFRQFLADLETGTGGNLLPEPPQVWLRWSDDRGHTWSSPVIQSMGASGEYLKSLQWQRTGMSRDRVFEIGWSAAQRTALLGAWLDVTPAGS